MSESSTRKDEEETMVYVEGKLISVKELEKKYEKISIGKTPGNVKIVETLSEAEKPLSKTEISKRASLSQAYVRHILKTLLKKGYVLEFRIGRGRTLYYLLTEKGVELSESFGE